MADDPETLTATEPGDAAAVTSRRAPAPPAPEASEGEVAKAREAEEGGFRQGGFLSVFEKKGGKDSSELTQLRAAEDMRRQVAYAAGLTAFLAVGFALYALTTWEDPWSRAVVLLAAGALSATLLRSVDLLSMPLTTRLRLEEQRSKRPILKTGGDVVSLANAVAAVLAATRGQKPED